MPLIIDTHAHLDDSAYEHDLDEVVKRALIEDIWIITVGHDLVSSTRAVEIAERYPAGVFAAVGLHPLHVSEDKLDPHKLVDLTAYKKLAQSKKVVAIGECGLDFKNLPEHHNLTDREYFLADLIRQNQRGVFRLLMSLAEELRLPLLVHARDSEDEVIDLMNAWNNSSTGFDVRGIIHSFSGTFEQAKSFWNLGFLTSMTGHITHGSWADDVLRRAPLSRLAIESDCPYLTPRPWHLRRNEPMYTLSVARAIAGIKNEKFEDTAREITANVLKVLRLENKTTVVKVSV